MVESDDEKELGIRSRHNSIELQELSDEDNILDDKSSLFMKQVTENTDGNKTLFDPHYTVKETIKRKSTIDIYVNILKYVFKVKYLSYIFKFCLRSTKRTMYRSPGCISLAFLVMMIFSILYTMIFAISPMIVARVNYLPCSCTILNNATITEYNYHYFKSEFEVNVFTCTTFTGENATNIPSQFLLNSTTPRISHGYLYLPPNDYNHLSRESAMYDNVIYPINSTHDCWASPSENSFSVLLINPFQVTYGQWVLIVSVIFFASCAILPPIGFIFHFTAKSFNHFLLEIRRITISSKDSNTGSKLFSLNYKGESLQSGYENGDFSHLAFLRSTTSHPNGQS